MAMIHSTPAGEWTVTVQTEMFGQPVEQTFTHADIFQVIRFRQEATR